MPRGRPRKNPLPVETEVKSPVKAPAKETQQEAPDKSKKEKEDKFPKCDRCHKKIVSSERRINLTYLTGMATWHREVSLDKVSLCFDCCKELNKIIDDWLIDKGKGVKQKFT